jgi:hypothetical protein
MSKCPVRSARRYVSRMKHNLLYMYLQMLASIYNTYVGNHKPLRPSISFDRRRRAPNHVDVQCPVRSARRREEAALSFNHHRAAGDRLPRTPD